MGPNSTTEIFIIKYQKEIGRFFTEPLLTVGVDKFTDSAGTHDHNTGNTIPFDNLFKKDINTIVVRMKTNPNFPSDVFQITLN